MLKETIPALAYLASRGLDHPDLIDTFKLGYANRTLELAPGEHVNFNLVAATMLFRKPVIFPELTKWEQAWYTLQEKRRKEEARRAKMGNIYYDSADARGGPLASRTAGGAQGLR